MRFGTVWAYLCHRDDQNGTTRPFDHDSTIGCRGWVVNTPYSECSEFESQLGGRLTGIVRAFTLFINLNHPAFESYKPKQLKIIVKYSHAPHNDVLVNDGPHIRRWSRKIIIQYYNTIVLQLPTVFSTVTCCTGL